MKQPRKLKKTKRIESIAFPIHFVFVRELNKLLCFANHFLMLIIPHFVNYQLQCFPFFHILVKFLTEYVDLICNFT